MKERYAERSVPEDSGCVSAVRDRFPKFSAHEERRSALALPLTGVTGGDISPC